MTGASPLTTAMRIAILISLTLLLTSALFATAPELTKLEPRGAQQGTAVQLSLRGYSLTAETRLLSNVPGAVTKLTPKRGMGRELLYLLELSPDAAVGAYPIRVETPDGISNILLFTVGPFREVIEAESEARRQEYTNDAAADAEPFESPVTVNGTLQGADRDWYRSALRASPPRFGARPPGIACLAKRAPARSPVSMKSSWRRPPLWPDATRNWYRIKSNRLRRGSR